MVNIFIRKITFRKILAILIILGIMSSLCITAVNLNKNSNFSPILSAPLYGNRFYYSDNVFYNCGYGIPNCTAYAWGRAYELLGSRPNLCTGNAGRWYEYNKSNGIYRYGNAPRLGAIACFDNEYGGHVAVVEQITKDRITFSNSAYQGKSFYLSYANINDSNPGQQGWDFQGYIYIDDFSRDETTVNSMYITKAETGLNFRTGATTNSSVISTIPYNTKLYVTTVYRSGGYSWGYTRYNGIEGYCAIEYAEKI